MGVAFQLADDVIDLSSDPAVTGKTPGTDLREHVPTLPVLLLRRHVAAAAASATGADAESAALLAALDGDLSDDAVLADTVTRLAAHPVTGQARAEASRWAAEAVTSLDGLDPSPARDALRDFASAVVARTA